MGGRNKLVSQEMSYPPWTDAEIEAYAKAHTGEVEVAYEAGPAKNRQSLFFHGILSRPNNTWVATRRDKTINLQAADIDVYNLTPYARGQSEPAASDLATMSWRHPRRPRAARPTALASRTRPPRERRLAHPRSPPQSTTTPTKNVKSAATLTARARSTSAGAPTTTTERQTNATARWTDARRTWTTSSARG